MADSAAELQRLINVNGLMVANLHQIIGDCEPGNPGLPKMRWQIGMLENTRRDFARRYTKLTGERPQYIIYTAQVNYVANKKAIEKYRRQERDAATLREKLHLENLVQVGTATLQRIRDDLDGLIYNSDYRVTAQAVNLLGGSSVRILPILRNTLNGVQQNLGSAMTAVKSNDFDEARRLLTVAAGELQRIDKNVSKFRGTQATGAAAAETAIGFYAAVTAGVLTGGASLTTWQGISVVATASAAQNGADLALRAIEGKENLTGKDLWKAAAAVGTDTAMAGVGVGLQKIAKAAAGPLSKRLAAKAVERYLKRGTPGFGTHRTKILKAVEEEVVGRIASLSGAQLSHAIKRLQDGKKAPDWNSWEHVIAPLVGGKLEKVIEATAKEAAAGKKPEPAGAK